MRKTLVYGFVVVACLLLAQLAEVFASSFANYSETWVWDGFNPASPYEFVGWLIYAIAIALALGLAVTLRHRWKFGSFTSLLIGWILGSLIIPFFCATVDALWAGISLFRALPNYFSADEMPGFIFIALSATLIGLAVGKHLTTDTPSGGTTSRHLRQFSFSAFWQKVFNSKQETIHKSVACPE